MRISLLAVTSLGWALLGATCVPWLDKSPQPPEPTTRFGVTIESPLSDAAVPQGAVLTIEWTAYNTTGQAATARVYVESREDLAQTVLAEGAPIAGIVKTTTEWDTTDLPAATYAVYVEMTSWERTASTSASGRITIDAPPTFEFTAPTEDATFTQGGEALEIAWTGFDLEGNAQIAIGLDPDSDPQNGNEIFIHEAELTDTAAEASLDWDGNSLTDEPVEVGTYNLFALVSDQTNPERAVSAGRRITVQEADDTNGNGEEPVSLGIVEPAEDSTFLVSDEPLEIKFSVNRFEDTLIDLKIDTDDNHSNGNELTILSQRLVPGGTETDTFAWDGTTADDEHTPLGVYRLFVFANTGSNTPATADGTGLIFRREVAEQPLIALLEPATAVTLQVGAVLGIRWRDDDPTESAKIRLMLDDDPNPNEGEDGSDPEDMAELLIVRDRDAVADGDVHDRYLWAIPGTLAPGTYYVFGYILATEAEPGSQLPREQVSVAPGVLIIEDPANPSP